MAWIKLGISVIFIKDKDWNGECRRLSIACRSATQDVLAIKNWGHEFCLYWAQSVLPLRDEFFDDGIESGESNRVLPAGFRAHSSAKA
jgi:hypothetical protein